jgi:hypothetical protein
MESILQKIKGLMLAFFIRFWGRFLIFGLLVLCCGFGEMVWANDLNGLKIDFQAKSIDKDTLKIDVLVEGSGEQVLGSAFHFYYDDEVLDFLSFEKGDFLEAGGDEPIYLVKEAFDEKGAKLVVGASLRRGDVLPSGSGRLMSFIFQPNNLLALADAEVFVENSVVSSLVNDQKFDFTEVSWGSVDFSLLDLSGLQVSSVESFWNFEMFLYFASIFVFLILVLSFYSSYRRNCLV